MGEPVTGEGAVENARILVVEDSTDLATLLERGLAEEGFRVEVATRGDVALRLLHDAWELVILDLTLPDVPGEELLRFSSLQPRPPRVLVLTARHSLDDKLSMFARGCDDYMTKPFAFAELLSRVRALLRRPARVVPEEIEYEGICLDPTSHTVRYTGRSLALTPKEFAICRLLLSQAGDIVSREEILHTVWGVAHDPKTNLIEVHLANLRRKLEPIGIGGWLQTVRMSGIKFERPDA